jgi:ribosomal-protein-alanine N-acetyltransferase
MISGDARVVRFGVSTNLRSREMAETDRSGRTRESCIRSGIPADWDFVADLARQVFSSYGEYDSILPTCLDDPQFHTLVSEAEDRPAGFCMLSIGEDGIGEVVAVAVDPLWQGRGIGRQLMQAIVEDARGMGIRLLVLKTAIRNLSAQGMFRRVGFEETGRVAGYYAGGQTAIGMRKRI